MDLGAYCSFKPTYPRADPYRDNLVGGPSRTLVLGARWNHVYIIEILEKENPAIKQDVTGQVLF